MKTMRVLVYLAFVLLAFSSCSPRLSPFTEKLYEENDWTDDELKKIQFYVSDDIVLHREIRKGKSEIISGEIKVINGKKVEEVVIPKGTPGVLIFKPKEDRFAISFEDGKDDAYLMFGPSPKAGSRYVLLASDWKRRRGKITYEGKTFYTPSRSAYASLMVDLKRIRKVSVKSRKAKGRKIN